MSLLPCSECAFGPRPVKELAYPRLVRLHQLVQRTNRDFLVRQHGDTATDREQRREVMGDDDDGNPQALVQAPDQRVDKQSLFRRTDLVDRLAVHKNLAAIWPMQAGERLEQDRFARPRAAGDAEDFPAQDVETDLVVYFLLAEPVDDVSRRQNGLGMRLSLGAHRPSFSKRMENNASSTITTKIALTTARVVSRPTLSAEPLTLSPCMQPMMAIRKPKTGALTRPTKRSLPSTAWCTRSMYCSGDTCSSELEIIAPPSKPMMSEKNVSSGSVMTSPINRGTTSNSMGSMPITLSASISSRR